MRSNVYYLPAAEPVLERAPRLSRGLVLRLRLISLWFRLKITVAEVTAAVRRFGRPEFDADPVFLEERADLALAALRPPRRPARILDFVAARARLRGPDAGLRAARGGAGV